MQSYVRVVLLVLLVSSGTVVAEEPTAYIYKYKGKDFDVHVIPGSKCCIEVSYDGVKGYLGVASDASVTFPYRYTLDRDAVIADGVVSGSAIGTAGSEAITDAFVDNLNGLCDWLLREYREIEGRKHFDPNDAYDALRAGVESFDQKPER